MSSARLYIFLFGRELDKPPQKRSDDGAKRNLKFLKLTFQGAQTSGADFTDNAQYLYFMRKINFIRKEEEPHAAGNWFQFKRRRIIQYNGKVILRRHTATKCFCWQIHSVFKREGGGQTIQRR